MVDPKIHDIQDSPISRLSTTINLIENILRYQVLANTDTLKNSIISMINELFESISKLPRKKCDAESLLVDDENGVTESERIIADIIIKLKEIQSAATSADQLIKEPVRKQMKSLSGIRKFSLPKL